ncbi:hypothetical protein DL771_009499 [Monosporascus sp. 5C6A]|nr:hypothetical protein DL771_009499 [Monosporascus sp. 5C6A]
MPLQNQAAYLVDKHGKPLEVRPAPYTAPGPDELVIRNEVIAINPVDVGVDVSGVVVDVGSGGKAGQLFKAGDRVVGLAVGTDKRANKASEGAFQQYTVLRWYEVLATASPRNFGYLKSLGASMVFDYKETDTVLRIIDVLQSKTCAGALAVGIGSLEACIDIVAAVPGRKFVSQASLPVDMSDMPKSVVGFIGTMLGLLWWNISIAFKARFRRVSTKFIWGSDVMANEVGPMIYHDFLPDALAKGQYQPKPDPRIVGDGLESL